MSIQLPTSKVAGARKDPALLVIAGFQKAGKTTALAGLNDNLIVDLEHGTDFIDAMKVSVCNLREFSELIKALRESEHKYRFITLDTGTKLEEVALELAVINYKKLPIGKRWEGGPKDILNLANGLGYSLLQNSYLELLSWLKPFCSTLIVVCHIKNSSVQKDGEEIGLVDISLTGKLKTIIAAEADAVGVVYRRRNQTVLSFKGGESFLVEARPQHLRGKEFIIMESDIDNNLTINWNEIFPS